MGPEKTINSRLPFKISHLPLSLPLLSPIFYADFPPHLPRFHVALLRLSYEIAGDSATISRCQLQQTNLPKHFLPL